MRAPSAQSGLGSCHGWHSMQGLHRLARRAVTACHLCKAAAERQSGTLFETRNGCVQIAAEVRPRSEARRLDSMQRQSRTTTILSAAEEAAAALQAELKIPDRLARANGSGNFLLRCARLHRPRYTTCVTTATARQQSSRPHRGGEHAWLAYILCTWTAGLNGRLHRHLYASCVLMRRACS